MHGGRGNASHATPWSLRDVASAGIIGRRSRRLGQGGVRARRTDYLVVGAGASGLAFADALVAEADVEVTLVDRRPAPGGHWLRRLSVRPPAHPVRLLRGELAAAGRGPHRRGRRERRVLRAGDGRGGPRATSPRRPRGSPGPGGSGSSPSTSTWGGGPTASWCETCARARCTRSLSVARWSMRATSRRRCRPRTRRPFEVAAGRPRRARQRPAGRRGIDLVATPCSGPARRRWTRAPGSWTTVWSRTRSAGSGPATPGFTIAPFPAAGAGRRDHGRASPSMPRPAPRRRTSTICSSGSRPRGGWSASTRRSRRRCTAARCSAPASCDAVRQIEDVVRLGHVRRIETRPDPPRARRGRDRPRCPARGLHGARPARRARPRRSSSPAGSCSSRCGTTRRRSTRPSWASSRPTGTTTPRRTGSAHPTRTRAASTTGRA